MKMKDYEVTLHLSGSYTFFVSAPDEDEAIYLAHDLLDSMGSDLHLEVTDIESCEVDGSCDD